jgi:hypothetical protein
MKPTIGNWYRIQGNDSFEVVAFDEDDEFSVFVQYVVTCHADQQLWEPYQSDCRTVLGRIWRKRRRVPNVNSAREPSSITTEFNFKRSCCGL